QYPWKPGTWRSCGANSSIARRVTSAVSTTPWYVRMTVYIAFPPRKSGRIRAVGTIRQMRPPRRAAEAVTFPRVNEELLDRYADLIVSFGANVQPDQVVAVEGLPEAAPLIRRIARGAYERGARYVD